VRGGVRLVRSSLWQTTSSCTVETETQIDPTGSDCIAAKRCRSLVVYSTQEEETLAGQNLWIHGQADRVDLEAFVP